MPLRRRVRFVLALFVVASPLLLRADFPAPNAAELKMTAEPKAPGASAVYLYREQITLDNKHYETIYERIKVLTEKGCELATVRIPYEHGEFKIKDVEGRTVHADGTIVPLSVKPTDMTDFKTKGLQLNEIVFNLPSVEVGSVLEYRVKLVYDDETAIPPTWAVQQDYFTREAHFQFHPTEVTGNRPAGFTTNLPDRAKVVQDKRGFTLDIADVPATPDEDWMPPLNTTKWQVQFSYSNTGENSVYWGTAAGFWRGDIDDFTKPSPFLIKTAQELTASTDTPAQKAQKLYAAVQKLENTSFTRSRTEAERKKEKLRKVKSLDDIWKNQSGSSAGMALLYIGLARAAGLTVYPMEVVDRDRAIFDPDYHSDDQLDDYLAIVELDGKEVYLDPGEKMCPYGQLHWKHTLATGLREVKDGSKVAHTPAIGATVRRIADVTIAADGSVSGTVRILMGGPESLGWRQRAIEQDADSVRKTFNDDLNELLPEGVRAEFDHFVNLDDSNSVLVATANLNGNLGAATGKRMFLPGLFFASHAKHPFVAQDKRITPIDVHFPLTTQDDVTYRLPAGYTLESAPRTAPIEWPQHATLKIDSKAEGSSVDVTRTLAYSYVLLGPSSYTDLHDFYQKIATADQQQVVLAKGASTK